MYTHPLALIYIYADVGVYREGSEGREGRGIGF